ncbi:hypothetical protein LCGC14_2450380 [marine sediment metagenome]|uniref:Uncharacterized protein n=1 Tax=marine sediment metagenome TaxID=412755 RepID=A0A0F9DTE2_9ZZZZ
MAYCTVADLAGSFKRITFDATSEPTSVEATVFCDEVSIEMDATMQTLGITVPVAATNPLVIAKTIAINGSLARVLRSVEMEIEAAVMYQGLFDKAMKSIIDRPEIMNTVVTENTPGHQEELQDRRFHMGEKEW